MTTKQQPVKLNKQAPIVAPSADAITDSFTSVLSATRSPTKKERKVGEGVRLDMSQILGMKIKRDFAGKVTNQIAERTMEEYDELIAFDRAIRDEPRDERDQQDMETMCHAVRESQTNVLFALHNASANLILKIATTPIELTEEDQGDELIIEQPGFFRQLFGGGSQVTRVRK